MENSHYDSSNSNIFQLYLFSYHLHLTASRFVVEIVLKIIEEDSPWFELIELWELSRFPPLPSSLRFNPRFYGETIISRKLCAENGGEYSSGKLSLAVLLALSFLSSNFFRLFHSAVIDKALFMIAKFFAFSSPLCKDRPLYLRTEVLIIP